MGRLDRNPRWSLVHYRRHPMKKAAPEGTASIFSSGWERDFLEVHAAI
jgi:hypothetical protein